MKDNRIKNYILDPSPLTELTAALDDINGWDMRDETLRLYMQEIFDAEESDDENRKNHAYFSLGVYVWAVLHNRVKSEVEVEDCEEDVALCQSMGEMQ